VATPSPAVVVAQHPAEAEDAWGSQPPLRTLLQEAEHVDGAHTHTSSLAEAGGDDACGCDAYVEVVANPLAMDEAVEGQHDGEEGVPAPEQGVAPRLLLVPVTRLTFVVEGEAREEVPLLSDPGETCASGSGRMRRKQGRWLWLLVLRGRREHCWYQWHY
jgi:hypothetical protein